MVGRYELVAVDKNKKGKIIASKNNKKLTLQEADIFTSLFQDKNELAYYLCSKGYIDETPEMFVLLYHTNKKSRYLNCLYKENNDIIKIAKASKENNKVNIYNSLFGKLLSYLIRNADNEFIEYAYHYKYINKYVYDKLLEYRYNKSNSIIKAIERELSKEYLQVRKLYSIIKLYNNKKVDNSLRRKIVIRLVSFIIQERKQRAQKNLEKKEIWKSCCPFFSGVIR